MSKEENILRLFFNESSKHWHFEEILRESRISRDKLNKWLKKFLHEKLIKKIDIKDWSGFLSGVAQESGSINPYGFIGYLLQKKEIGIYLFTLIHLEILMLMGGDILAYLNLQIS